MQNKEAGHKLHTKHAHTEGLGSASMPITIDGDIFRIKEEPKEAAEQKKLTRDQKETKSIHNLLANPYSNVPAQASAPEHLAGTLQTRKSGVIKGDNLLRPRFSLRINTPIRNQSILMALPEKLNANAYASKSEYLRRRQTNQ